jgi:acetoacetate decarboxylase
MPLSGEINMAALETTYKHRAYPSKEQKETLTRQMFLLKEILNSLPEKSKEGIPQEKLLPVKNGL